MIVFKINGFIIKNKWYVPLRHTYVGEFTVREFRCQK